MLTFTTDLGWNAAHWEQVRPLYEQIFPNDQRKSTQELRNLFNYGLYSMHLVWSKGSVAGFAFTAALEGVHLLFLDYMAVSPPMRSQGIGACLIQYLVDWTPKDLDGIVGEVDAPFPDEPVDSNNRRRVSFYETNGFQCIHKEFSPGPHQRFFLILRLLRNCAQAIDLSVTIQQIQAMHSASRRPFR